MFESTLEQILVGAYELWQKAGEPKGKDEDFKILAEQDIQKKDKSSPLQTPDTLRLSGAAPNVLASAGHVKIIRTNLGMTS